MVLKKGYKLWLIATLLLATGMLLGAGWASKGRSKEEDLILINSIKFRELLSLIHSDYIDLTDTDSLADAALESIVEELDPHSSYIPKKDVFAGSVQLESNFEGIGAEFQFIDDTVWVSSVMKGSPSDKSGLKAGDRILTVNRIAVSGNNISHLELTNLVRGPKGTLLICEIIRISKTETVSLSITRDRIQSKSVEFFDMPVPGVGIIKCSRFTHSTGTEMREAIMILIAKGMKNLILDLRDNSGGYVSAATRVADEFLKDKKLIVYTEGRNPEHNAKTFASSSGLFEAGNLVVVINENTASAAEIVTGALQDHDRALIFGRRSFGKGLVQAPITLTDGSEVRLTISRYFTPSGRCIQKGFQRKKKQAYFKEFETRLAQGECYNFDSIHCTGKPVFKTQSGRKVYGGGGIIPDVFAARDSIYQNDRLSKLIDKTVLYAFILKYHNDHSNELINKSLDDYLTNFELTENNFTGLYSHLKTNEINLSKKEFEKLKPGLQLFIKAGLAKCLWQYDGFYKVLNKYDNEINKAIFYAPRSERTIQALVTKKTFKSEMN